MWILSWGEGMKKTKALAWCAVMLALALALSYVERWIPLQLIVPLPGIKLGLANIVMLLALQLFHTRYAYWILVPRCVLSAAFGGGLTGLAFSLCGGLLAVTVMAVCKRVRLFSVYGISVLGAAAHSIGQILAAMLLMRSVYIGAYLPYLLMVSTVTGLLTGAACAGVLRLLPGNVLAAAAELKA